MILNKHLFLLEYVRKSIGGCGASHEPQNQLKLWSSEAISRESGTRVACLQGR